MLASIYPWLKVGHLICIISWFAGLFYLPRLFVYHALASDSATQNHLKIMERKLYRFVTPFALLTLIFGILLGLPQWQHLFGSTWFQAKLLILVLLYSHHIYCGKLLNELKNDVIRSDRYYRVFNEIPVLFLFAIIILVVIKPF